MTVTIETKTCGRCGGTGNHSFNSLDGSRCYGCSGSGNQLTPRGKRARKALEAWTDRELTVPASSVVVGDRILTSTFSGRKIWATVTDVTVSLTGYQGSKSVIGDTEFWQLGSASVSVDRACGSLGAAHRSIRKAATPEQLAAYEAFAATLPGVTVS
jgi:hypothetical protein